MSQNLVQRDAYGNGLRFRCPGCDEVHVISVSGEKSWQWNGDLQRPVVQPSISIRTGHFASHFKPGDSCWCTYNAEHPDERAPFACRVCHSFIGSSDGSTPGRIQFWPDSTHALVGQTVDIPPWDKT